MFPDAQAFLFIGIFLSLLNPAFAKSEYPYPGDQPSGISLHAFIGGDIQVTPEKKIKRGILIIRDGKVEAVGKNPKIQKSNMNWDSGCRSAITTATATTRLCYYHCDP